MTSFSQADQKELKIRLNHLRQVCCPATQLVGPYFKFTRKKDFHPADVLHVGSFSDGYDLSPDELKGLWDWEDLRDNNVQFIQAKRKKWFFNTQQIITDFFSQDGSKKVEVRFPYWIDCENIWKNPENIKAMKAVLEKCSGKKFPTQKEAIHCFPKPLLQQIYEKNPSRASIEHSVMEIMETLRKKIANYLEKNHVQDILKEPGFLTFSQQKNTQPNKPDTQKVKEYLAGNKQAMYFLAQKFGLIKNASRIIHYEQMRDHVRHPNTVRPLIIEPQKIYHDFALALGEPLKGSSRAKTLKMFAENSDLVKHLGDMSEIWTILDQYVDPKLVKKKNKADYYNDLIQKGIITKAEAKIIRRRRITTNEVAHLNHRIKRARQKVMADTQLQSLALDLYNRHMARFHRWIEDKTRTV